jgi:hypothetical protein
VVFVLGQSIGGVGLGPNWQLVSISWRQAAHETRFVR